VVFGSTAAEEEGLSQNSLIPGLTWDVEVDGASFSRETRENSGEGVAHFSGRAAGATNLMRVSSFEVMVLDEGRGAGRSRAFRTVFAFVTCVRS
jgi:hypothetical protein